MSYAYRINEQNSAYFLTFTVVGWVDIFTRKVYKDILIDSLKYCQQHKGLNLYAYVIMSNHVHLIVSSEKGDLSGFVRDFKRFTSQKITEVAYSDVESRSDWLKIVFEYHAKYKKQQVNQVWKHESHAEQIHSKDFLVQKINYIHNNPVRAGIVVKAEDYIYSSAVNYAGFKGEIDIIKMIL